VHVPRRKCLADQGAQTYYLHITSEAVEGINHFGVRPNGRKETGKTHKFVVEREWPEKLTGCSDLPYYQEKNCAAYDVNEEGGYTSEKVKHHGTN
jgi:hypothetical protein